MSKRLIHTAIVAATLALIALPVNLRAQELPKLEEALKAVDGGVSAARQRLAARRVIRDAQKAIEAAGEKPERWALLDFLFRAQQQLIRLDDDPKYRADMIETCRELVKAPDEFASLRLKPDLLLSQVEQAKSGSSLHERAKALRPFVDRYVGTPAGPEAIKTAVQMASEFGDSALIADLRQTMQMHYASDHAMIQYQRERFEGQAFAAPLAATLKRSDGKLMCFPMDAFGTSCLVLFWSKEGEGMQHLTRLAEACKTGSDMAGRLNIISCNLDELDDAGESMVRGLGVDWPCLHLPGGREHPVFKTYGGKDPYLLRLSATAQTAIGIGGVRRHKEDGSVNYDNTLKSYIARNWTDPAYSTQLRAMSAGEFLIFDPGKSEVLSAALQPIQRCFVAPPMRHHLSHQEQLANLRKAVELCRKAIAEGSDAADLWMVRDRLIIALMSLWKSEGDLAHLKAAFVEAKTAIEAGYPDDKAVIARFCLARQALRDPEVDRGAVIDSYITDNKASGPALAAACMLAIDAADRVRFEQSRELILKQHTNDPSMWAITAFLLDRHHLYWMFKMPYTFGWIYNRREGYFITDGNVEAAKRMLKAELRDADGKAFRIPEDLTKDYTAIIFAAAPPWNSKRGDGLAPSPGRAVFDLEPFVQSRPDQDVQVCVAVLGEKPYDGVFKNRAKQEVPCTMLAVPNGLENSLVKRLGMPTLKSGLNGVILGKDGRILKAVSGLSPTSMRIGDIMGNSVRNLVARQDELKALAMIEKGQAEEAKQMILALAPHQDPEQLLSHLRARARVYAALGDWEKALADAETVTRRRARMDADMSELSAQLGKDEAFRDEMKARLEQ